VKFNKAALHTIRPADVSGDFFRLIRSRYAGEPLSMYGSFNNGGRYNVAGLFGALYLGLDPDTCHAEVTGGILAGVPTKPGAFKLWTYAVALRTIVRLDDPGVLTILGLTISDITIPGNHWTASEIGEPLFNRGLEGLVAPSSQKVGGLCLDVFLDHVKSPSAVNPMRQQDWP